MQLNSVKILKFLTLSALLLAFGVIILGAYTRLSDAGLGCPDWPGCYGKLSAPVNDVAIQEAYANYSVDNVDIKKAHTEMTHRYFAGTLGVLVLLIYIISKTKTTTTPVSSTIPSIILMLTLFQALLGMWTVTLKLLPIVVLAHLIGGLTILSFLTLFYLQLKNPITYQQYINTNPNVAKLRTIACIALFFLSCQIILGGLVSANYAALTCYDFPYCQGELLPQLDFSHIFNFFAPLQLEHPHQYLNNAGKVTLHMLHRIGAIFTSLIIIITLYSSFKYNTKYSNPKYKKIKFISYKLLILLLIQIGLGIANVVHFLPISIAVLHNAVAALLLVTIITFIFYVTPHE